MFPTIDTDAGWFLAMFGTSIVCLVGASLIWLARQFVWPRTSVRFVLASIVGIAWFVLFLSIPSILDIFIALLQPEESMLRVWVDPGIFHSLIPFFIALLWWRVLSRRFPLRVTESHT